MSQLGPYYLDGEMSNANAGYCMWGFGTRSGRQYFIKQFLSPKYPFEGAAFTDEYKRKRVRECEQFERQKKEIYSVLNQHSDGNDVRVLDFFRIKSRYYMCMEKVNDLGLTVEQIYAMDWADRLRLCTSIAHAVAGLHQGRMIHADLKHDNILYTYTQGRRITAKVIDFDSSFLETNPPKDGEEIVGDQLYFSPEAREFMDGQPVPLTCKMDVFALGILFHQYLGGSLPLYDRTRFHYPADVVLSGQSLDVVPEMPAQVADLLRQMLQGDPGRRPTAWQCFVQLREAMGVPVTSFDQPEPPAFDQSLPETPVSENPWHAAGDL